MALARTFYFITRDVSSSCSPNDFLHCLVGRTEPRRRREARREQRGRPRVGEARPRDELTSRSGPFEEKDLIANLSVRSLFG